MAGQYNLDSMAWEARNLVVVALMHYHATQEETGEENLGRDSYIKEIRERWNHPTGRQLRLSRDRWITEAPGWSKGSCEMFHHIVSMLLLVYEISCLRALARIDLQSPKRMRKCWQVPRELI